MSQFMKFCVHEQKYKHADRKREGSRHRGWSLWTNAYGEWMAEAWRLALAGQLDQGVRPRTSGCTAAQAFVELGDTHRCTASTESNGPLLKQSLAFGAHS